MVKINYWPGLDLAKFLCIISMIAIHLFFWFLLTPEGLATNHYLYPLMFNFLFLAFFNLSIPATAGSTLRLYINNQKDTKNLYRIISASITIAVLGYIMNPIAFGQKWIFSWNVLQFVALSFIIIVVLNHAHKYLVYLVAILSLIFIDQIKSFFSIIDSPYLNIVFIGNNSGLHLWPFFPWFATLVLGYFVSDLYINHKRKFTIYLFILGFFLLIFSLFTGTFFTKHQSK